MKISVIIPIYNSIDCLEKCVRSVQAQTYDDLEIILVDDGSTDGTAKLIDQLVQNDEQRRTVAFHKENGGSSSARNLGIDKANGDYLGFVDSDDYIEPDMYEKLVNAIVEHDLLIAQTGRDEVSADGSKRGNVVDVPSEFTIADSESFFKELLLHRGDCSFCTKLISKSLFSDYRFPIGELNEDFWLLVQMITSNKKEDTQLNKSIEIGILPEVGYHVFYRENSNTRTVDKDTFPQVFTDIVVNADRIEKLVMDNMPELSELALRFALVQRLDYLLHIPISKMTKDNEFYQNVAKYINIHRAQIKTNQYLSDEQRRKLKLLSINPKAVRQIHRLSMKLRGIE